jgi:hypothetical protein
MDHSAGLFQRIFQNYCRFSKGGILYWGKDGMVEQIMIKSIFLS